MTMRLKGKKFQHRRQWKVTIRRKSQNVHHKQSKMRQRSSVAEVKSTKMMGLLSLWNWVVEGIFILIRLWPLRLFMSTFFSSWNSLCASLDSVQLQRLSQILQRLGDLESVISSMKSKQEEQMKLLRECQLINRNDYKNICCCRSETCNKYPLPIKANINKESSEVPLFLPPPPPPPPLTFSALPAIKPVRKNLEDLYAKSPSKKVKLSGPPAITLEAIRNVKLKQVANRSTGEKMRSEQDGGGSTVSLEDLKSVSLKATKRIHTCEEDKENYKNRLSNEELHKHISTLKKVDVHRSPGGTPLMDKNCHQDSGEGLTPLMTTALRKRFLFAMRKGQTVRFVIFCTSYFRDLIISGYWEFSLKYFSR
ncbi:uncharacterized protein LOC143255536 isoform X2 [Tachypleus tridentatus]|uniref:uncharacterized protein LOC143255536 isoform X2 n=1 Tax=Tachypleus tridentatus TaxID=6853 RepID=UPI003FD1872C